MKKLKKILPKNSGRSKGTITVRHQGGRKKRFLRKITKRLENKSKAIRVRVSRYHGN